MKILVVDNLSPFTPQIVDVLNSLGSNHVECAEFSQCRKIDVERSDQVILSGRRSSSTFTNKINSTIVKQCLADKKPLLGICYGAEIIALTLGGSLRRMQSPSIGPHEITILQENSLTLGLSDKIQVYESHGFAIARLPSDFRTIASSNSSAHEIFQNTSGQIWGTQFHPEKSGQIGKKMLQNFVNLQQDPD